MPTPEVYIFDDGPLSHFAEAGWLGLLGAYVGDGEALLPDTVHAELQRGVDLHGHLRSVLDASWLRVELLSTAADLSALATFTNRLVGDDPLKNLGECGVLALAKTRGGIAVIDDRFARQVAKEEGIRFTTTLDLLLKLVQGGHLSMAFASRVADELLRTEYILPIGSGGFGAWAAMHGLYDEPDLDGTDDL
ncbi:putative nucleic acid-binding protein [Microbacterium natoriense]|uniref:Nucleic acid-binding protein n=1 Tax=Microbacterium natoriense TaxID=284570 RepID=A0AAW8F267_9MICO|nr:nucleotide-binding protein [Microbacterium natoriense]MDQ0648541.1 putative nucleic acid-binding protein [Microbacterium natoriense]